MHHDHADPAELRGKFWKALAASPFVMLQRDADADSAAPMTAQLDPDARHQLWFFTSRSGRFAAPGRANATFVAKGHDLFARFEGELTEESSRERLEKQWNNAVEAWFPAGPADPDLLMLRMDLGHATIWSGSLGVFAGARMMLGMDVRGEAEPPVKVRI